MYVAEQPGRVRVVDANGDALAHAGALAQRSRDGNEQGLLGLTFSADGTKLYVDYTDPKGDTHVDEYTMRGDVAVAASAPRGRRSSSNRSRTTTAARSSSAPTECCTSDFGDGGSEGDPNGNGQNLGTPEIDAALRSGMEFMPERRVPSAAALAEGLGRPLTSRRGAPLVTSLHDVEGAPRSVIEGIVRTAAGVFDAAAASIALADHTTGGLVFHAAWGAGAREIIGVRLAPGQGIAGAVHQSATPIVLADCRSDPRFAADIARGTNYVPVTMLVLPLLRRGQSLGTLTLLDRRDGEPYGPEDVTKAQLFADLAVSAL